MNDKQFLLSSVISVKDLQDIQDRFSSVTGVSLRIIDEQGAPFTTVSSQPRLCSQIITGSRYRDIICGNCLPTFLGGSHSVNRNLDFICLSGLHNYIVPLTIENNRVLGYLIVGPVFLVTRQPKEEYRKLAEELKIDINKFWDALLEIKIISYQSIQSLVELIHNVIEFILKCSCQNVAREKEIVLKQGMPTLNRTIKALLDVAFQVSGADVGSVMFLDKDNDYLTIQASRGIADDIVKSTRVRMGEGISGLVAKENRSILIDDNSEDVKIKSRLNRPQLKAAMSLPIKSQEKIMGVMNLGILRTSPLSFNRDNLKLMDKLIDLATVAISSSELPA